MGVQNLVADYCQISSRPQVCSGADGAGHNTQRPFGRLRRLIGAVEVTEEQPWKLVTFCVQTAEDAADVCKRNKGEGIIPFSLCEYATLLHPHCHDHLSAWA